MPTDIPASAPAQGPNEPPSRPFLLHLRDGAARRVAVGALIPVIVLAVQEGLWGVFSPYVWFLFYPAAFFAALLVGLVGGITATLESAAIVWYVFMQPRFSVVDRRPADLLAALVFILSGISFSLFSERLERMGRVHARRVARRDADRHASLLVENSMDGVLLATEDGAILAGNREAERIFRCTADEL